MASGVSVIVPCLNRRETIIPCIESILNQEFIYPLEVIVCDDGSTDGTLEVLRFFGSKIKLIEKEPHMASGAAAARNRGLDVAKHEFVAFLDSDDYYLDEYLASMVNFLNNHPELGYAFCRAKKETIEGERKLITNWTRNRLSRLDKEYHVLYRANVINTNVILVRREVIEKAGRFCIQLTNGQDSDMWMRISEICRGAFVDIFGSVYRINHSGNQLTTVIPEQKNKYNYTIGQRALQRYKQSNNPDILRLLLIHRHLLYCRLTQKVGFFYSVYRKIKVNFHLLKRFPITYFRFLRNILLQ